MVHAHEQRLFHADIILYLFLSFCFVLCVFLVLPCRVLSIAKIILIFTSSILVLSCYMSLSCILSRFAIAWQEQWSPPSIVSEEARRRTFQRLMETKPGNHKTTTRHFQDIRRRDHLSSYCKLVYDRILQRRLWLVLSKMLKPDA